MLVDAIERAKRDVSTIKDMEWNLWNTGKVADPKSPSGGSYAFMKPKPQSVEISNSSFVLQFASRRFLDQLLGMSHKLRELISNAKLVSGNLT